MRLLCCCRSVSCSGFKAPRRYLIIYFTNKSPTESRKNNTSSSCSLIEIIPPHTSVHQRLEATHNSLLNICRPLHEPNGLQRFLFLSGNELRAVASVLKYHVRRDRLRRSSAGGSLGRRWHEAVFGVTIINVDINDCRDHEPSWFWCFWCHSRLYPFISMCVMP